MLLGLRSHIHPTADLAADKAWWTALLGVEPYFDEPFYVGFDVAGYELALNPGASLEDGPVTYWGVADCEVSLAWLLAAGATPREPITEVGDAIRVASVTAPSGAILGIIENPHFALPDAPPPAGPGR